MRSAIFAAATRLWHACRMDYAVYLEAFCLEAETATNGNMLNARGRAAGVTSWSLFLRSPAYVEAYASDELRDWLRVRPRLTFADFEQQWLDEQGVISPR